MDSDETVKPWPLCLEVVFALSFRDTLTWSVSAILAICFSFLGFLSFCCYLVFEIRCICRPGWPPVSAPWVLGLKATVPG